MHNVSRVTIPAVLICASLFAASCSWMPFIGGDKKKNRHEDIDTTEQVLYNRTQRALRAGNYNSAIEGLQQLEAQFPFGRYAEQAQLEIIYAQYMSFDHDIARQSADRFIRLHPQHANIDYAYYLKGLVNFEQNLGFLEKMMPARVRDRDQSMAVNSFLDFSELIRRFPDSRYVPDARQRMIFLRNNLAAYEITVAEYYLRREAYVAAANRARYALETYPNTPQNAEALIVLHKAYTALELPDLAEGSMTVLALNYPDNYYVLGQKKPKSWAQRLWPFD